MTQEEKVKAYDEAIERARKLKENPKAIFFEEENIHVSDYIFPELKKSEDERIRKEIIEMLRNWASVHYITKEQFSERMNWLEKQGNYKSLNDVAKEVVKDKDAAISFLKSTGIMNENGELSDEYKIEQDEQKPTKNTEPKFHEGDWIVNNDSGYVYEVTEIKDDEYCLWPLDAKIMGYFRIIDVDNDYHFWSIQDSKDGDVLVGKIDGDSYVLIYKQIKDGWIETYGHYYNTVDRFCVPSQLFCRDCKGTFYPATKEQREQLEKAMADAGYTFDFEKKELKKIKPTWSEEDEKRLKSCLNVLQAKGIMGVTDTINTKWLKSLKDRVQFQEDNRTPTFIDAVKYDRNTILYELEKIVKDKEEAGNNYVFAFSEVKELIERIRHENNSVDSI